MNVAKPFSALIGVYIKVIYSASLVLTKVYTQTTTTAKTFTLINFLPMQNATTTPASRAQAQKKHRLVCNVVKQKTVEGFHQGGSIIVSQMSGADAVHSPGLLCLGTYGLAKWGGGVEALSIDRKVGD